MEHDRPGEDDRRNGGLDPFYKPDKTRPGRDLGLYNVNASFRPLICDGPHMPRRHPAISRVTNLSGPASQVIVTLISLS